MDEAKQITIESIRIHEGYRGTSYIDTQGQQTIGYGRNLNQHPYTITEALDWTVQEINDIFKKLSFNLTFSSLSPIRQAVIAEMTYQLGLIGVSEFKKMWEALSKKDYIEAAQQIRESKLYQQAPIRTESYAYRMQHDALES